MVSQRPLAVGVTPMETRREVVLHLARKAEALGYDSFALAEGWGHDAGVLLAEIAGQTERIRIGTGVLNVWGRSPATMAMLATSLADVSEGRFFLGLGSGSPPLAEGFHDVPFTEPVGTLEATVRQVRRLLNGERIEPTRTQGTRPLALAVRSASEIPIYLAALGPRATRVCGELADGWTPFLLPVSGLPDGIGLLDEGARRADRPRPLVCPSLPTAVAATTAEARELASWWVAFYLVSMGPLYRETLHRVGYGAEVEEVLAANPTPRTFDVPASASTLIDELIVWGEPDRARATLDSWYAAGAQMPSLVLPPGRDVEVLDHILETLRPE
jgi:alkanesulfonate monooxygenase SsuD/methylene tetrahydromethanopterin reductase-like flavin-dependent oxidoreductase (luciferase family)